MNRLLVGVWATLVAGAILALGACASRVPLVSEDTLPDLAELKQLTASIPNHTELVETGEAVAPVRLAVHRVGSGEADRVLVMLHGVFADHTSWRFIQGRLAGEHDLLLLDLPGCGGSDKPDPDSAQGVVYRPTGTARAVLDAVRAEITRFPQDKKLVLIGHSFGGMVVLRMFADPAIRAEYADVLDRVDRLVLLAPVDAAVNRPDPLFQKIAEASSFEINLGLMLGVIQASVADATFDSVSEPDRALREEYEKRIEVLRDARSRRALQAMVSHAVPWDRRSGVYRPNWPVMESIVEGYSRVDVPTLILWGTRDETLPISMGYKLAAELPRASLFPVPGAMHSIHIERPLLTAEVIDRFVRTGAAPGPATARIPR